MWFFRRILKVSWTARRTNRRILRELRCKQTLLKRIREQQCKFFGHHMRKYQLEHLITTAKLDGKRSRGRMRESYLDGMARWVGVERNVNVLRKVRDRDEWRGMVAYAFRHGT